MTIELERMWPQRRDGTLCRVCMGPNGGWVFMENTRSGDLKCPKCGRTHEGLMKQEDGRWILISP